jgi:hypothetical protein
MTAEPSEWLSPITNPMIRGHGMMSPGVIARDMATMATANTDRRLRGDTRLAWEVDENEYGDPMVAHMHPAGWVPAYVIGRWEGGTVAQCSACMANLELDGTKAAKLE